MVYIHSDDERKLPHNFDAACALYGALDSAQNIRLTSLDEVGSGKFDSLIRKHLFVGSVDFMHMVFARAGIAIPSIHHLKYDYITTTLGDARSRINNGETWFIKPVHAKLFTGMVFNAGTISQLSPHSDDIAVLISKPFEGNIVSETRCYVHHNKIVDTRNYAGNFRRTPGWAWADAMIATLSDTPVAFTMDVAVLDSGASVVVEYNDMWAIGNYGMQNDLYYQMLLDRYFEIMTR